MSAPKKESVFFRIIAFLSLIDTEVLAKSGRYDRMLAFAMVFRQLVTFAFTFLLFTYGVSLFLGQTAAIVSGFVFALTLFFLDQAIIGSDWALKNPFKGGFPFRKIFGLIPRIFYSLIIAIGLATLAEISLQANAIDEQIQKDVVNNNKEYFARMNVYEQELDTAVNISEQKAKDLQQKIKTAQQQGLAIQTQESDFDKQTINNTLDNKKVSMAELKSQQKILNKELLTLNKSLSKTRKDYQFWFNEAILERTGKDGRAPTEGEKYKRAVKTYEELKLLITSIEKDVLATQNKIKTIEQQINAETEKLNDLQLQQSALENKQLNLQENQKQVQELEVQLVAIQKELKAQIEDKQLKLEQQRMTLQSEGLFYERKTGVLTRYLALQKIHLDPVLGEVATLFSYMLKIFFIAIELMPVIIKLFFSPFSFYSLKMYRKMQVALLEEKAKLEYAQMKYEQEKEWMQKEFDKNREGKVEKRYNKAIMV